MVFLSLPNDCLEHLIYKNQNDSYPSLTLQQRELLTKQRSNVINLFLCFLTEQLELAQRELMECAAERLPEARASVLTLQELIRCFPLWLEKKEGE